MEVRVVEGRGEGYVGLVWYVGWGGVCVFRHIVFGECVPLIVQRAGGLCVAHCGRG